MHKPHEAAFTALNLKSLTNDGVFEGYASLFNTEDLGRDSLRPGAFTESLARKGPNGIRLLFQHNPAEPIGIWESLVEDGKGLLVRGRLMTQVARAREVLSLLRSGAIDGLSIGFRVVKAHRDRVRGVRRIEKVDLWEISVVTFPMLPAARIRTVKTRPFAHRLLTDRGFERRLTRHAGLTHAAARSLHRNDLKGLSGMRQAAGPPLEVRLTARLSRAAQHLYSTSQL